MEIKQANVYKEYKLAKGESGEFMTEHKTLRKGHCVIDAELAEIYNSNTYSSGLYYELDVEATALLHKDINQRRLEKIARSNKTTYSKPEPQPQAPIIDVEKKTEAQPEENNEQQKYDKRKEKLIAAGFEFDEIEHIFVKGEKIIKAEEVLTIAPVTFGKLTKK